MPTKYRAFVSFARRDNSTADGLAAIRRGATIGVLALAVTLISCEQKPDQAAASCQRLKNKVEAGVTCMLVKSGTLAGEDADGNPTVDAEKCPAYIKSFRALGLTSHDAGKIHETSLDSYYKAFKGAEFCEYMKDKLEYLKTN
jgi:hypothetical protein